ncbi:hypothetical protein [Cytobacillus sp. SAFR-174]|uniref:hypothetical protein n=1 Tax=Cytobacillus sp. SAFR-174 TaxID=3436868 RepID=UPI003F81E915
MTCFFSLENFLHELCFYFEKKTEYELKKAKDKGLKKYTNYLKQFVLDKNFFGTELWERITFFNDLINTLAHADGRLDLSSNKDLADKLEKKENILVTDRNEIRLTENFLEEVTSTLHTFLFLLYKQLESYGKR